MKFTASEWDEMKATANVHKHGVSFSEAVAVFRDSTLADFDASAQGYGEIRREVVGLIDEVSSIPTVDDDPDDFGTSFQYGGDPSI